MKRFYSLMTIALLALCIGFVSCSKDDDEKITDVDLGGTEWKYEATGVTTTLYFLDNTRVKRTRILYGYSYDARFTYSFDGKDGIIYQYYDGKDYKFTVENDRLTLDYEKYYKK